MSEQPESQPSRLEKLVRRLRRREVISLLLLTRFLPDRSGAPEVPPPWRESDREIPADLLTYPGEIRDAGEEDRAQEAVQRVVQLYLAWHEAEPDAGHDEKAESWLRYKQ